MKKIIEWIKNRIGDFLGYGRCECGRSFWWVSTNNPGLAESPGSARILCDFCYNERKEEIEKHNEQFWGTPRWDEIQCAHEQVVYIQPGIIQCTICGAYIPISCEHGGSVACEECTREVVEGWRRREEERDAQLKGT